MEAITGLCTKGRLLFPTIASAVELESSIFFPYVETKQNIAKWISLYGTCWACKFDADHIVCPFFKVP